MPEANSVRSSAVTSDERIQNALRRNIRKALDSGDFTRASLAEESGVNIHCIDMILTRDPAKKRRLSGEDMLNLAYTLGDAAVNAVMATIQYGAQRLDEASELNVNGIVASGLQQFSIIATAAADGRIDHQEEPACQEAADQIIATFLPLSSAGK